MTPGGPGLYHGIVIRRQNPREGRAGRLAAAGASQRATTEAAMRQTLRAQQAGGLVATRGRNTTYYNNPAGFTVEQMAGLDVPDGATRIQLVIRDPNYGKKGYRSTGWIQLRGFNPTTMESSFGINPGDIRTIHFS